MLANPNFVRHPLPANGRGPGDAGAGPGSRADGDNDPLPAPQRGADAGDGGGVVEKYRKARGGLEGELSVEVAIILGEI